VNSNETNLVPLYGVVRAKVSVAMRYSSTIIDATTQYP